MKNPPLPPRPKENSQEYLPRGQLPPTLHPLLQPCTSPPVDGRPSTAVQRGAVATAAATSARLSAAVSYLRMLTTLVMRAPTPNEAAKRTRVLVVVLIDVLSLHAGQSQAKGLGGADVSKSPGSTSATIFQGVTVCLDGASAVIVRSVASDCVVLCMQTLRFLLGWAGQAAGSALKNTHTATPSSIPASEGAPPSAAPAPERTDTTVTRWDMGAVEDADYGEAPLCLHGLRALLSDETESGTTVGCGSGGAPSATQCFVCPLIDRARRCAFVQVAVRQVRAPTRAIQPTPALSR